MSRSEERQSDRVEQLPYGRQCVDEDDIAAVSKALRSDWLTTGPAVEAFENAVAERVRASHGVALSSGTAALHAAMRAVGIGPGDEVVVPAMTFIATANAVVFEGARPIFADVSGDTLLVDPVRVEAAVGPHTKAIVTVDYAGQPCQYDDLRAIADGARVPLVADGCHALGAQLDGSPVGSLADLTVFSFHPVKHITTAEGGMVVTDRADLARVMQRFRNHGISHDFRERAAAGSWEYQMVELGYNYRLSDVQCALGLSQLHKLDDWLARRRQIAGRYDEALAQIDGVVPLSHAAEASHAYHLYVIQLDPEISREGVFSSLQLEGIGVNVHYLPVHLHDFYRRSFGTGPGLCPVAESAYERILTLPIFPAMTNEDVNRVVEALRVAITSRA